MTAPAKSTNPSAAKSTAAKAPVEKPVADDTPKMEDRIPAELSANTILADFCKRYLEVHDEIAKYNESVLAEKDSEWTPAKVLEKARELGNPTDANVKPNAEIKSALDAFEKAAAEHANARRAVIESAAKALNITLSSTAERDPAVEGPLKEKRKIAVQLGSQLSMIAQMTTDENASAVVTEFLANSPLPAIGREQTRSFSSDGKSTPKYRVTVKVTDLDGNVKLEKDGFTQTALALTKFYERGKAPKSDDLRGMWEKSGNTPEKTVVNPVEFEDNNLKFTITKK